MATTVPTTETTVTLRLSDRARAKLAKQAANSGQDLSPVASDLIEQFVTRPSIAEIMAPVHKQAADSGMSDAELNDFLRGELEAHRRAKKPSPKAPKTTP
jgi:hypothetical protein